MMGAVEASCWRGIERSHQRASRFCRLPLQWVFRGDLRQASNRRASIAIAAMMFRVWCKQVCVCVCQRSFKKTAIKSMHQSENPYGGFP